MSLELALSFSSVKNLEVLLKGDLLGNSYTHLEG